MPKPAIPAPRRTPEQVAALSRGERRGREIKQPTTVLRSSDTDAAGRLAPTVPLPPAPTATDAFVRLVRTPGTLEGRAAPPAAVGVDVDPETRRVYRRSETLNPEQVVPGSGRVPAVLYMDRGPNPNATHSAAVPGAAATAAADDAAVTARVGELMNAVRAGLPAAEAIRLMQLGHTNVPATPDDPSAALSIQDQQRLIEMLRQAEAERTALERMLQGVPRAPR